jgi:hypothetical protein
VFLQTGGPMEREASAERRHPRAIMSRMLTAAVRRRAAALRQPAAAARLARVLWVVWAIIVWNVAFDHVIVVAGREYIAAASAAAAPGPGGATYARMDDWMRPALSRALWIATAASSAILVTGLVAVRVASRSASPLSHR